jgi:hypothetical protein
MSQHQVTSTPVVQRYGRLGASSGRMVSPLHSLRILLFGKGGEGKTAFVQSFENAFIINCDLSGTTSADPKAAIWPAIDQETGRAVSNTGAPISFNYEEIRKVIEILKDMAKKNEPRPLTVVIDSLTQLVELIKNWVVENARKLSLVGPESNVTEFSQLMGQAAWDRVYGQVTEIMDDLKSHGYGVIMIAHVANEKKDIGDNRFVFVPTLVMGKGLWTRLQPRFDMSASIKMESAKVKVDHEKVQNGKTIKFSEIKDVTQCVFDLEDAMFAGITKRRLSTMLTKIPLPLRGSWEVVDQAYRKAVEEYLAS